MIGTRLILCIICLQIYLCNPITVCGQSDDRDYEHFKKLVEQNKRDSVKAGSFAIAWLEQAKKESNWRQQALAYKTALHFLPEGSRQVQYADSMLIAAKHSNDNALIGASYVTKGMLVVVKDKEAALDNYLMADKHIALTNDKYSLYKVKYVIGQTKFYLGFYDEAISLFEECHDYYATESQRGYLNSLHALGLCFNRLGKIEQSSAYNKQGIAAANSFGNHKMDAFFQLSEAVNDFYRKQYQHSIEGLRKLRIVFSGRKDLENTTVANFYLAKNYWAINKKSEAIPYLQSVDSAFSQEKYIRPELRQNYELLIDYYKEVGNQQLKDHYVDRLLRADRILDRNFEYLSGRIYKVYDTRRLIQERDEKESRTLKKFYYALAFLGAALAVSLSVNVLIRVRNRKLFQLAMEREPEKEKLAVETEAKKRKFIFAQELADALLIKLERFEKGNKFLEKNITSTSLAKNFHTNPKYIAELVKHFRGKRFTPYINDFADRLYSRNAQNRSIF